MEARRLRPRYELSLKPARGFSLLQTISTYSFGWQFDGRRGFIELCPEAVAILSEDQGSIIVKVYASSGSSCWEEELTRLSWRLGLEEDLGPYHSIARGDPLVGCIPRSMPGHRLRALSLWSSFLTAVCQQNASFRQGWRMLYKLHLVAGDRYILETPSGRLVFLSEPRPGRLDAEKLRIAGLGYRAGTIMEGLRFKVHELGCSEAERLREIRGVGDYTYNLVKLLACRDYNSLPLDRWLRKLASEAYGVSENDAGDEIKSRFREWSGLAALHATIAFDAQPLRRALERLRRGENCPGLDEPSPITLWRYMSLNTD